MLCLRYKPGVPQITSRLSCDRCHIFDTTYTSTYDNSLIKPLVQIKCWLTYYFREFSRITDYCYSRPMVLSLWKSFFARFFSRYKFPCSMGKCKRYESNIPQQAYKACPITAWVLLQNESERIRTFNILPPARSLSNTRSPCARLPFRHTLLNGISAVSNIFFVLCFALGSFLSHSSDFRVTSNPDAALLFVTPRKQ